MDNFIVKKAISDAAVKDVMDTVNRRYTNIHSQLTSLQDEYARIPQEMRSLPDNYLDVVTGGDKIRDKRRLIAELTSQRNKLRSQKSSFAQAVERRAERLAPPPLTGKEKLFAKLKSTGRWGKAQGKTVSDAATQGFGKGFAGELGETSKYVGGLFATLAAGPAVKRVEKMLQPKAPPPSMLSKILSKKNVGLGVAGLAAGTGVALLANSYKKPNSYIYDPVNRRNVNRYDYQYTKEGSAKNVLKYLYEGATGQAGLAKAWESTGKRNWHEYFKTVKNMAKDPAVQKSTKNLASNALATGVAYNSPGFKWLKVLKSGTKLKKNLRSTSSLLQQKWGEHLAPPPSGAGRVFRFMETPAFRQTAAGVGSAGLVGAVGNRVLFGNKQGSISKYAFKLGPADITKIINNMKGVVKNAPSQAKAFAKQIPSQAKAFAKQIPRKIDSAARTAQNIINSPKIDAAVSAIGGTPGVDKNIWKFNFKSLLGKGNGKFIKKITKPVGGRPNIWEEAKGIYTKAGEGIDPNASWVNRKLQRLGNIRRAGGDKKIIGRLDEARDALRGGTPPPPPPDIKSKLPNYGRYALLGGGILGGAAIGGAATSASNNKSVRYQ